MHNFGVMDFETDPFKFDRLPKPFSVGFKFVTEDSEPIYLHHWGKDSVQKFFSWLADIETPLIIYAHNGGKFDYLFFIEKFCGSIKIVNGRILEGKIGIHTFRDSYAILPIPLGAYQKDEIDYRWFEENLREKFKTEILHYLKKDCDYLFELVSAFILEFGNVLTIGSASMREFKKFHKFEKANKSFDKFFRQYYFGGRCQCFETGIIEAPLKIMDLNSAYPDAMLRIMHPVSVGHDVNKSISKKTIFVCWEGKNDNAVPMRINIGPNKGGLDFTVESGTFWSTVHEFNAGLDTGTIMPKRIKHTIDFWEIMSFADFVTHFYESRQTAKADGNKILDIFYKLILNSSVSPPL